jgi:hypothetical protein
VEAGQELPPMRERSIYQVWMSLFSPFLILHRCITLAPADPPISQRISTIHKGGIPFVDSRHSYRPEIVPNSNLPTEGLDREHVKDTP